ncbi:MAG: phytase [Verrucomicrobiota bacterium JB022]|nr:phytase [Verrucomicrobiota bacterium JB022]
MKTTFPPLCGTLGALLLGLTACQNTPALSSSRNDSGLRLNEVKAGIPDDVHALQFIELVGPAGQPIQNTWLLVIDGDDADNPGTVDIAVNLDGQRLGANGLLLVRGPGQYADAARETAVLELPEIRSYSDDSHPDGLIEHDAVTFLLVQGTQLSFRAGDDLDPNNAGELALPTGTQIVDSVGWLDNGAGVGYTPALLNQSAGGPDAASRLRDHHEANAASAWANGGLQETSPESNRYNPNAASVNLPPNAKVTPGHPNFAYAPFALLNEVAAPNTSSGGFVEVLGHPHQSLDHVYLVGVAGHEVVLVMSLDGQATNLDGIFYGPAQAQSDALQQVFAADVASLHLVYSPKVDLSRQNLELRDNLLRVPAGVQEMDRLAWTSNPRFITVQEDERVWVDYPVQAVTRYRDNRLTGPDSWTYGSLDGDAYAASASKNVPAKGHLTPGRINVSELAAALVMPTVETARTTFTPPDADDPAFWHHPTDPSRSLVLATQKEAGYSIYDAQGRTLKDAQPGDIRFNNVDVVYGFPLGGEKVDLAVFTDRFSDQLGLYRIQPDAPYLIDVTDYASPKLFDGEPGEDTAYGSAAYVSPVDGSYYAFATQNGTNRVAQVRLVAKGAKVGWEPVREIVLAGGEEDEHAEGMVVDQERGILYVCQEPTAVYHVDAEPTEAVTTLTADDFLAAAGDDNLREDIEGVTIYYLPDGRGYILVSSQGSNTFAVYDRANHAFVGSFAVVANGEGIDGSQDCDGLDVTNMPLGPLFPQGVLIVHDGQDRGDGPGDYATNFKWVPWERVAEALGLEVDTSYNPRAPQGRR